VKTVGQRFTEWLAQTLAEVHREPCHRCRESPQEHDGRPTSEDQDPAAAQIELSPKRKKGRGS
jgi:hypothetical protein